MLRDRHHSWQEARAIVDVTNLSDLNLDETEEDDGEECSDEMTQIEDQEPGDARELQEVRSRAVGTAPPQVEGTYDEHGLHAGVRDGTEGVGADTSGRPRERVHV